MKTTVDTVAVVQWRLDLADFASVEAFGKKLDEVLFKIRCSSKENLLVAFPEDLVTFGILTELKAAGIENVGLEEALRKYVNKKLFRLVIPKIRMGTWVGAVFNNSTNLMEEYFSLYEEAAQKYNCFIVAGSGLVADGREIYNEARGYGKNNSKTIQRKVHLIDLEGKDGLGLTPASLDDISLWQTSLGTVGVAICYDGFFQDIRDKLQDCDIFVQPSANPGPWTKEQQVDWLLSAYESVQSVSHVVLNPMLTGKVLGIEFFGQSSILVRGENRNLGYLDTGALPNFVQIAKNPVEEEILMWHL